MKVQRTPAEAYQIEKLLSENPTFYRVFSENWTNNVLNDLKNRLFGKIPRNFLVNITGLIGTPTGIFKSTLGLQLAYHLDPNFNLKERVAFSINDLLDKIKNNTEFNLCNLCFMRFKKEYTLSYEVIENENENIKCDNCENIANKTILKTKMIFFLDEQTKTLKTGGLVRLQNLVDTCRQRQICFITCGVEQYGMHFTTYNLKRVQESSDEYLPLKRVRYAVYDDERDIYYGYFQWDITPLTNQDWKKIFDEYSKMKTDFQRIVIQQQIQTFNYEDYAMQIINDNDFVKCFKITKDGRQVLQNPLVRNLIIRKFPDLTNQERENILAQVRLELYDENETENE